MDKLIANHWNTLCKSATASAEQLAQACQEQTSAAAMRQAAQRFCQHSPPQSRQELQAAYTRRMSLSAHLTAIARADAMAVAHPAAKDRILEELQKLCAEDFADDGDSFIEFQRRNLELTEAISAICFEDASV